MSKSNTEREIQNNAQMIYGWLRAMARPQDAVATLMMAHAGLVWSQRPADEADVRKLLEPYIEGVVALWKAQAVAVDRPEAKHHVDDVLAMNKEKLQ